MADKKPKSGGKLFDEKKLRRALKQREAQSALNDIHVLVETGSTNDEAAQLARDGAGDRTLVLTENQTMGRGRRGSEWASSPGLDLLFSLVLRPPDKLSAEQLGRLPHLIGVAVCRGVEDICPFLRAKLKWPNDVYINGRKVAGILVENAMDSGQSFTIAGIGINANSLNSDRPEELSTTATSLAEETGEEQDRHQVAAAFLANFHQLYPVGLEEFDEILAVIEDRSLLLGARISAQVGKTEIEGKAIGFGPNGELMIDAGKGGQTEPHTLISAEQVRLI